MTLLVAGAGIVALMAGGGFTGWRWWQAKQSQSGQSGQSAVAQDATTPDLHAAAGPAITTAPNGKPIAPTSPAVSASPELKSTLPDPNGRPAGSIKPPQKPGEPFQPSANSGASPQAPSGSPREATPSGPFSPEHLNTLDAAGHLSLSNSTLSEATALASSNPAKALEGLRNALAANPYNSRAYAWALVISYNSGRYGEMKTFYRQAKKKGLSLSQLEASNAQLKTILDNEAFNHRIPGGLEGNE